MNRKRGVLAHKREVGEYWSRGYCGWKSEDDSGPDLELYLRFQIQASVEQIKGLMDIVLHGVIFQEIEIDVYEDDTKSNVKKSAKVALLLCC